jgi:hypothetical protein
MNTRSGSIRTTLADASDKTVSSYEIAHCWIMTPQLRNMGPVCVAFTYDVDTGKVTKAAPLIRKFIGQSAESLIRWFTSLSESGPTVEIT